MSVWEAPTAGPPAMPPPGWYPDPLGGTGVRWFDGLNWTDHIGRHGPVAGAHIERGPHPTLPRWIAGALFAATVLSLVIMRLIIDLIASAGLPIPLLVLISAALGYGPVVAVAWYVSQRRLSGSFARDYGFEFRPADVGWGPLIWVVTLFSAALVGVIITKAGVPYISNTENFDRLRQERAVLIALGITAIVIAPLVEELVFRGGIMRSLLSWTPPWLAVVLQGAAFGLVHISPERGKGNIGLVIVLSCVGMGFGAAAYWLRRLGPTIVAHGVMNTVALILSVFVLKR